MNAAEVLPELLRRGIPSSSFAVEGVHVPANREGVLLLRRDGDAWVITVLDRAERSDVARFTSEHEAAISFIGRVARGALPIHLKPGLDA